MGEEIQYVTLSPPGGNADTFEHIELGYFCLVALALIQREQDVVIDVVSYNMGCLSTLQQSEY